MKLFSAFAVAATIFWAVPAYGGYVTWNYAATVEYVNNVPEAFTSPLGLPVTFTITMDPQTPDTFHHPNPEFDPFYARFALTGGDTRFAVQIGNQESVPLLGFSLEVDTPNRQIEFRNLGSTGFMHIDFPGYEGGLTFVFRFLWRKHSLLPDASPASAPNPSDFEVADFALWWDSQGQLIYPIEFLFGGKLTTHVIPEPTTIVLLFVALVGSACTARRR